MWGFLWKAGTSFPDHIPGPGTVSCTVLAFVLTHLCDVPFCISIWLMRAVALRRKQLTQVMFWASLLSAAGFYCSMLSFFPWLPPTLDSGTITGTLMSHATLNKLPTLMDPQFLYMLMALIRISSMHASAVNRSALWGSAGHSLRVLLTLRGSRPSLPRMPAVLGLRLKATALRRVCRCLPSHIPHGNS